MAIKQRRSTAKTPKDVKKSGSSLATTIKAELAKPVVPGQILFAAGDIEAVEQRETKLLTVKTSADRPISAG